MIKIYSFCSWYLGHSPQKISPKLSKVNEHFGLSVDTQRKRLQQQSLHIFISRLGHSTIQNSLRIKINLAIKSLSVIRLLHCIPVRMNM